MSPKDSCIYTLVAQLGALFWRAVDSLGDGVSLEEVSYCWVSLEVDSLAQLSAHSPHAPASQCFPSMMDCVPSNHEPKHKVNFLTCVAFCQIFGRAARKTGKKLVSPCTPGWPVARPFPALTCATCGTSCERAQDLHDGEEV